MTTKMLTAICLGLISLCSSQSAIAQAVVDAPKVDVAKIDELMAHLEKEDQFMGSLTLSKGGEQIFSKAYGMLGEESGKPIDSTPQTKYRVGSISKMFTSTLILQMIESNKLALTDHLSKFFPKFENADSITIDQMLRHRSGIGSITSDPDYLKWCVAPMSRAKMMEKALAQPTAFQPGEQSEYSNSNFILLGFILEDLSGKTYGELLQEKVCKPLKLTNTYYGKKAVASEGEALSYKFDGESWKAEPETHMSVPHGAGAVVSTTEDLATFASALFAGKLINDVSLKGMKDMSGGLGQGLFTFPFNEKKAFGHGGAIDGFQSNLAYFPAEDLTVAFCANGIEYSMNEMLIGILSRVFGEDHELPKFAKVDVDVELLKKYVGVYSTDGFPLKITIGVSGKKLTGQATGQPVFKLNAVSTNEFTHDPAGVRMKFVAAKEGDDYEMEFKQGPVAMTFTKEKETP